MRLLLILSMVTMLSFARCVQSDSGNKRTVDTLVVAAEKPDSLHVLIADLPVQFDSTDVLLYKVGMKAVARRTAAYGRGFEGSESYSFFEKDHVGGSFVNVVFEDKSGVLRELTDLKIEITSMDFLRDIFSITKRGYILYTIIDHDTNGDGKFWSGDDIVSLYISDVDGTGFRKLTKSTHEYYDHVVVKSRRALYFRTREDVDKDGKLTNSDMFHYYKVDFADQDYKLIEYDPLKNLR